MKKLQGKLDVAVCVMPFVSLFKVAEDRGGNIPVWDFEIQVQSGNCMKWNKAYSFVVWDMLMPSCNGLN